MSCCGNIAPTCQISNIAHASIGPLCQHNPYWKIWGFYGEVQKLCVDLFKKENILFFNI